jgi:hypothetical protein
MRLLLLLVVTALAAWSPLGVMSPPDDDLEIRSVAVALDSGTSEKFFVCDTYDEPGNDPFLFYKHFDGSWGPRHEISDDIGPNTSEGYLQSIATEDGETHLYVAAKWATGGDFLLEELKVDQSDGSVDATTAVLSDDFSNDIGHNYLWMDAPNNELHSVFTVKNSPEDVHTNHRDTSGAYLATAQTVSAVMANKEQHGVGDSLAGGGRVFIYYDEAEIKVRMESTVGTPDWTESITPGDAEYDWPWITVRTVNNVETLHAVYVETSATPDTIKHRSCPLSAGCDDEGNWSIEHTVEVSTTGNNARHPQIVVDETGIAYVVYADEKSNGIDRIRVSHLCPGTGSFVETDGGEVDNSLSSANDEEAFSTQDADTVNNGGQPSPSIALDDADNKVRVAYVLFDASEDTWAAKTSATAYPSCN